MTDFDWKRISDPVHGTIGLSELEVRVISSRAFQRLRNIKQLGLVHYVFPSADYSRFSHSIGVCNVTGRILSALQQNTGRKISEREIQCYRLAGLPHDIGHYPFSHPMEVAVEDHYKNELMVKKGSQSDSPKPTAAASDIGRIISSFNHERVGKEILTADPELSKLLLDSRVEPRRIYSIFIQEEEHPRFANLVNSDLDADRIDYLLRTAHHTGLPYGSVDLDYLLSQIRVDGANRICLTAKALRTVDHFLLSRYFDYQQVEFHKTVVGLELVLKDVLKALLQHGVIECSPEWVMKAVKEGTWYGFDDLHIWSKIREFYGTLGPGPLKTKIQAVLERTPPKLVGEIEFVGDRDRSTIRSHQLQKQVLRGAKEKWANEFNMDPELWYIWDQSMALTKMGSSLPVSATVEPNLEDKEEYEKLVKIQSTTGSTSAPIVEVQQSLMYILANYALYTIRLYVLFPSDLPGDKDTKLRKDIMDRIKESQPDMEWK